MRINARLEELSATQLDFLVTRLGLSVSDVLRQGLDLLYKQQTAQAGQPLRHFSRHVGRYHSGQGNLSINYKAELAAALNAKWPRAKPTSAKAVFAKSEPLVYEVREPEAPLYGAKTKAPRRVRKAAS